MSGITHPTEPLRLTLVNGQERKFLLTMGGVRRVKERLGVNLLKDVLDRDAADCGIPVLYEALLEKDGLTEDQFGELLPANIVEVGQAVLKLLGISLPELDTSRPTAPSQPENQPATGTGSNSGASGSSG